MHQSVFKLYSQELGLPASGDAEANDESVMQTFARGMALFQGDSPDGVANGKATVASNWKMFCHLFQACSAYSASIASKVQGRSVVTLETLHSIQLCAGCAHSSIALETLQRRLTQQQFRDMYAPHAERMTLLLCEMEQAYPPSSAEWAVGRAGLESLCSAALRLPHIMLGPALSTVAKYARFGVRLPVPAAAKARSSGGSGGDGGVNSGTGKAVAREAAQLTLRVLCPEAAVAVAACGKAKKGAKQPDTTPSSSPSPLPPGVPTELVTVLTWFWADCALQAEELGLSRESLRSGWAALAALSPATTAGDADGGAWDRTGLVRAAAETQVAAIRGAEDVEALQSVLTRLRDPAVAGALSIGGGTTLGDWELLSYLPVLCLQSVLSLASRKSVSDRAVEQHASAFSQVWAAVQGLLVQKPPATAGAPLDAKQASQLGARLNCFSRGLAHVAAVATAQLKLDAGRTSCRPWLPAVVECALPLLGRTLLDAKCVPIVRRGLGAIHPLLAPALTAASEPSTVCLSLAALLKSLFGRARDLPEPERMEVCAVANAFAVVCGNSVLKLNEGSACDPCAALLACIIEGTFVLQTPSQRVSFAAKRAELFRLLSRCLVHRPESGHKQEKEGAGELSEQIQTALSVLVCGSEHVELRAELKLVFSGLYLHAPAAASVTSGGSEWVSGRLQAVLSLVCDPADLKGESLMLSSSLHWGGVAILTVESAATLLQEVRVALTEVDPESSLIVFSAPAAAQKKAAATKAKKEAPGDSAAAQLRRACWRLRLWTLRAAWADAESCEVSAGSGKLDDSQSLQSELKGRCLVAAVQALRAVETLLQKCGQAAAMLAREELLEACHAFVGCGRMLFAMLHLGGRLTDTACLFRAVSLLVTATGSVVTEICSLADDLRTQLNVLSVANGVHSKAEEIALAARFAPPVASNTQAALLDRFCLVCLALLHSSTPEERLNFVNSVVGTDAGSEDRCRVPADSAEFTILCKQVHRACSQRQQQQQEGAGAAAPGSWEFLPWVCAVASKVLWIAFQDVAEALVWGTFANSCAKAVIEGSGATSDSTSLARLALVEVLLQRAELYEHCGNLDSAVAYLREVNSAAKALRSPAMHSVVALHTVRVWYRASSPRLHNAVADLVGGGEERIYSSTAELRDETSELARAAAAAICALFPAVAPDDEGARDATARDVASLRFRYLDRYWDVQGAQAQLPIECVFNCLIPARLKTRLHALLNPSGVSAGTKAHRFSGVVSPTSGGGAELSEYRSLLTELAATGAFDAIRDLRRRLCLASLTGPKPALALDPFLAFVAGAASCGVAVECWEQASGDAKDGSSPLLEVTQCVNKALLGCADSAAAVKESLDGLLRHGRSMCKDETGGSPALSFLCTDRSAGVTLVGRYGESGPMVVALPLMDPGAGLSGVLQSWDEMQERSKSLLRQGLDVEQAARLSEEQKRGWWAARQGFDAAVEASMSDLQDLLGPWRVLLSTQPLSHDLHTRCASALNGLASDFGDSSGVLSWLALVCGHVSLAPATESAKVVARTLLLSRAEAVTAVAQVLAQWRSRAESEMVEFATRLVSAVLAASGSAAPAAVARGADVSMEATDSTAPPPMTTAELQSLKVAELRVLLKDAGLDATGKKQDLVNRLEEHMSLSAAASLSSPASNATATTHESVSSSGGGGKAGGEEGHLRPGGHLTVLLDEQLQRVPLETMPCLRAGSCSRVPSFALLLKIVAAAGSAGGAGASAVDDVSEALQSLSVSKASAPQKAVKKAPAAAKPKKASKASGSSSSGSVESEQDLLSQWQRVRLDRAWYALDIEGNLPLTRSTLQPFLGEYQQRWQWTGVVATVPPEQTTKSLHESSDLFIFCGHGAGEAMCDPFRMRRFASCPAALLWGCSSGVLRAQGVHDALGTALYYLLAGAPFLVANLWDVTDKDIDKLCMAYMSSVFAGSDGSGGDSSGSGGSNGTGGVAMALAQSRGVCRMANAVGSAPVLYGVPLAVHDSSVV